MLLSNHSTILLFWNSGLAAQPLVLDPFPVTVILIYGNKTPPGSTRNMHPINAYSAIRDQHPSHAPIRPASSRSRSKTSLGCRTNNYKEGEKKKHGLANTSISLLHSQHVSLSVHEHLGQTHYHLPNPAFACGPTLCFRKLETFSLSTRVHIVENRFSTQALCV
jgi:hypothetical protein